MSRIICIGLVISVFVVQAPVDAQTQVKAAPASQPAQVQQYASGQNAPKIRCDQSVYEFPEVWGGEEIKHAFILHNDGNAPLQILDVKTGCGCTTSEYDKMIPPGGQGKISFTVKTNSTSSQKTVSPVIRTNDPTSPTFKFTITGKVKPVITLTPASAQFGRINRGQKVNPKTIVVTNHTSEHMQLETIPNRGTTIFSCAKKEVEAGKVYNLIITPSRPFRDRVNSTYLRFKTGISKMPEIRINCYLFSPPTIEVNPPSGFRVYLPNSPSNSPRRGIAYVKYNNDGQMHIKSVKCTDPVIKTEMKTQTPGKSYQLFVHVPGDYQINLRSAPKVRVYTDVQEQPVEVPIHIIKTRSRVPSRSPMIKK